MSLILNILLSTNQSKQRLSLLEVVELLGKLRRRTAMMAATASAPLLDEDIGCVLFQQVWNGRTMEGEVAMDVGGEAIEKDTTPENTSSEAVEDDETPMKTEEDTVEGEADLKAEVCPMRPCVQLTWVVGVSG